MPPDKLRIGPIAFLISAVLCMLASCQCRGPENTNKLESTQDQITFRIDVGKQEFHKFIVLRDGTVDAGWEDKLPLDRFKLKDDRTSKIWKLAEAVNALSTATFKNSFSYEKQELVLFINHKSRMILIKQGSPSDVPPDLVELISELSGLTKW